MATKNSCLGGEQSHSILKKASRVVMVGIGGVGMYSIAALLHERKIPVVGQDGQANGFTEALAEKGVAVALHNGAFPLREGDAVVYTAAVSPDHPTLQRAREMELPLLSRADALAGLMQNTRPRIAVAGMHGESTTTALLGHILERGQLSPTIVCGAIMAKENSPFRIGTGPFVFEACEYMASFLSFSPDIALVLNMEWEHIDCYPTMADVTQAFSAFTAQSREPVLCYDEKALRPLAKGKPALFYSLSDKGADCHAEEIRSVGGKYRFALWQGSQPLGEVALALPGKMNVSNAVAAAAVALRQGVSPKAICESLSEEKGVKRRLEHRGFMKKTPVFDDYAHHPTEIVASLSALREVTKGRVICVFQSHTYSRTFAFFTPLIEALSKADTVLVAEIYPARETDTLGMSGAVLAQAIGEKAIFCRDFSFIAKWLLTHVSPDDTVVVMGAGNIDRLFSMLPLSAD